MVGSVVSKDQVRHAGRTRVNDEAAFIRQICLTPDDDAPRLIFADWLDENDHPERAEFIRVQIRLAELRQEEPSNEQIQRMDEVGSLAWRQRALWAKRTLVTEIASSTSVYMSLGRSVHESHLAPDKMSALIRRGFVDEIRCTLAEFMAHAQTIALTHPVRKWVLTDAEPFGAEHKTHQWWRERTDRPFRPDEGDLPNDLFEHLSGGDYYFLFHSYRSEADANADLQQACYHYARIPLLASIAKGELVK